MTWFENYLACPVCKGSLLSEKDMYRCNVCNQKYPLYEGIPVLMPHLETLPGREDRSVFWNEGWKKQLENNNSLKGFGDAPGEEIKRRVEEDWKLLEGSLYTVEANREIVSGKVVLDIGCGAGSQGPIFESYGARYIGLDFSYNAAFYTQKYIRKIGGQGVGINGRAEYLPIKSNSVDFVFSHGVLHHTPKTQETFEEVYRCLKPGGSAAIGLYVTFSPVWIGIRARGWLAKVFSQNPNAKAWYHLTEGGWITGNNVNPWTKTYTKRELTGMFTKAGFKTIKFRKSVFNFGNCVPIMGKYIDRTRFGRRFSKAVAPALGSMWCIALKK